MKNNLFLIFLFSLISCSNEQHTLTKYLTGNSCKLWKPQHWDEFHFECFDTNGKRAIYKLENGKLSHVTYIDDIVYDWDWKFLNDTTILLVETPYKITKLNEVKFIFTSPDGFELSGEDASSQFNVKNCDCKNLIATKK